MADGDAPKGTGPDGLRRRVQALTDPRHRRGVRHELTPVVLRALAAVVAGQRSWVAIGDGIQGGDPPDCPRTEAADRVPSEPTLRRVLQPRDGDALDAVLTQWLTAEEHRVGDARALDSKSLRGSAPGATGRPVPWRAALIHRTGPVAGQVLVETQTHEIPKRQDLLDPLDVAGRVVTVDAWPTQTEPARDLVEDKHAHDVMTAKGNPPAVRDAYRAWSRRIVPPPVRTGDRGPGRMETRVIRTATALHPHLNWPGPAQMFRVDRPVTALDGTHSRDETAYGLTDLTPAAADAAPLGACVRPHWGIETRLHYIRDMTDAEDRSPVRTYHGPRIMATLRNTAIDLLRTCGVTNIPRAANHLGPIPTRSPTSCWAKRPPRGRPYSGRRRRPARRRRAADHVAAMNPSSVARHPEATPEADDVGPKMAGSRSDFAVAVG